MGKILSLVLILGAATLLAEFQNPIPDQSPFSELLKLIQNFSAMTPLMIAASVTTVVVQALRTYLPGSREKKLAVLVLSIAFSVIQKIMTGTSWPEAIVFILVNAGGAVAIYEWFVSPVAKSIAKKQQGDVIGG